MARAGAYRDRVTFRRAAETTDAGGGAGVVWSDIAPPVWARFKPERGGERVTGGRIEATVAGVLEVRYSATLAGVTTSDVVMIGGEVYNIRSAVDPNGRRKSLEMTVEKGVAV